MLFTTISDFFRLLHFSLQNSSELKRTDFANLVGFSIKNTLEFGELLCIIAKFKRLGCCVNVMGKSSDNSIWDVTKRFYRAVAPFALGLAVLVPYNSVKAQQENSPIQMAQMIPISKIPSPILGKPYYATDSRRYDTDLDGLSDSEELANNLNPGNSDMDGDGFGDGIELRNAHNPKSSGDPEYGNKLYGIQNIEQAVLQEDNSHRLRPVFDNGLGLKFAYIKTNSDYTSPVLCVADIGTTNSEKVITKYGDLGGNFKVLQQLTFSPDNKKILFDRIDVQGNIFYANVDGSGISALTNFVFPERITGPDVAKVGKNWYLFGARQGAKYSDKAVVAYAFDDKGNPDIANEILVGNINYSGVGLENSVRANGDYLTFMFRHYGVNDPKIISARGLEDILTGKTKAYLDIIGDKRMGIFGYHGKVNMPIGFSRTGNFLAWTCDLNGKFDLGSLDFSKSDFDFLVGATYMDSQGQLTVTTTQIPFVGNQPFAAIDKSGTRIVFSSDFNPFDVFKSEFSLLAGTLSSHIAFSNFGGSVYPGLNIEDPSGVKLTVPAGTPLEFPLGQPSTITISTDLKPIKDSDKFPKDRMGLLRDFKPSGTKFTRGSGKPEASRISVGATGDVGAQLIMPYNLDDITALGLVESTLQIAYYDSATGEATPLPTTVDIVNKTLEATVAHFSTIGVLGRKSGSVNVVKNWAWYE